MVLRHARIGQLSTNFYFKRTSCSYLQEATEECKVRANYRFMKRWTMQCVLAPISHLISSDNSFRTVMIASQQHLD